MALLEVSSLEASYGDFKALHGVSFAVDRGEIVSIVGANGAGKTTTLKTLMGIVRADGGSIVFDGRPITGWRPAAIVDLGVAMVPEGRNLFRSMSVDENLRVGADARRVRGKASARIDEIYRQFPMLVPLRNRPAGALSGGQQQIVAIARALVSDPLVLLMDEPSLGLSPKITLEVFALVREINARGVAVVLVEQNVVQALELASRAYVLTEGRTVMSGSAAEIRNNEDVKRRFLGEV
jgi:branched-chain amino acid transport system ATP-binding protein